MDEEDTDAAEAKEYGEDNVFLTLDGQCVNTTDSVRAQNSWLSAAFALHPV